MEMILGVVAGVVLGFVLGYLVSRVKSQRLSTEVDVLKEKNRFMESELQKQKEEYEVRQKKALEDQQQRFDLMMSRALSEMKNATSDMLKQRQEEFSKNSTANLGQIVAPLNETIENMKKAMQNSSEAQNKMSGKLEVYMKSIMEQSESAKKSADDLTNVLKHKSKVQGDWGEAVLDELLESQGLTRGIHYDTQAVIRDADGRTVKNEEGGILRPDVILHLDRKREVIIDSKVSLTAFFDYVNAEDEGRRQECLKKHIKSIQDHVDELSKKNYAAYVQPPKIKMEYVIMFVPHMGALMTAFNAQPDLWRKAMEKNVLIADERSLFATLKIISMTWTQITQVQNHEKVYELANEMMERVGQFTSHYRSLGEALDNARRAYDSAEKKLQPGGRSILQTCSKLEKLGAKQSPLHPLKLQDTDDSLLLEEE